MTKLARPPQFKDPRHLPPKDMLAEIGRMAVVSAGIEDILHNIYWKFARLDAVIGATITEDARPNRLAEDIIKIAKAAKVSAAQVEDLTDIFSEYRPLARKRNQCIHWIWGTPQGDNHKVVPPSYKRDAREETISLSEATELADDLTWIETRLEAHQMSREEIHRERTSLGNEADIYLPIPWLDKHLQPIATASPPHSSRK